MEICSSIVCEETRLVPVKIEVEETKSARGNPIFRVNNYTYEVDKRTESKYFCRCIRKKSAGCSARAIIAKVPEPTVLKLDREHNHEEEHLDRISRIVRHKIKDAALSLPGKTAREIYNEVLEETFRDLDPSYDRDEVAAALPTYSSASSIVLRTRAGARVDMSPALSEFIPKGEWTTTSNGEELLMLKNGPDNQVLAFSVQECADVEEIKSARGNPLFRLNDFLYEVDKRKDSKCFCRCVRKRSEGCPARAVIIKDPDPRVVKMDGEHIHEEERRDRKRRRTKQNSKESAISAPENACKEVFDKVLAETVRELQVTHDLEELSATGPGFVGDAIPMQHFDPPTSLAELNLGGEWTRTSDGEEFLLFNDGADDRILGFSTHESMRILCNAWSICMDGSFEIAPTLFQQLYTFHAFYKGQMMPLAFFLLPNRRKETYLRMFSLLEMYSLAAGLVFRPRKIQHDFGAPALEAIREKFLAAQVKGCNFHFSREIWRTAHHLGLMNFHKDSKVMGFLRSVTALSLVPLDRLEEAWSEVESDAPSEEHLAYEKLNQFKEYFKQTWLMSGVALPHDLWNEYRNLGTRAVNHIEDWHRTFARAVPNDIDIFEMITHLKKEEHRLRYARVLLNMGLPPPPMSVEYRIFSEQLPRLVDQLESDEISLIEYVRRVAEHFPVDQSSTLKPTPVGNVLALDYTDVKACE